MCDLNFINLYSFYYNDWKYFEWFRNKNEENFNAIIKWKGLNRVSQRLNMTFHNIWQQGVFNEEYVNNLTLVSRVFFLHLNNPNEYPLIDRYVWWALKGLRPEIQRTKLPSKWEEDYLDDYLPFFQRIYNDNF